MAMSIPGSEANRTAPARARVWCREPGESATGRCRILVAAGVLCLLYGALAGRLVLVGVEASATQASSAFFNHAPASRPDILDRNGEILATDIRTASLFAEPRRTVDPDEATELLVGIFPELDRARLRRELAGNRGFMWLKRELTPRQQEAVHRLGIPGVGFRADNRRFYAGGPTAAHILGHVNVDNQGIAGIEKHLDQRGLADLHQAGFAFERGLEPVRLSIDLRAQHAVRDELAKAMARYRAIAAVGIVMDVRTGEVVAMSSLPDYDPNNPVESLDKDNMNRATVGTFEMGSTFKVFTTAMALDSGRIGLNHSFDATRPLRIGGFSINDYRGKGRWLTVPEIFIYSSNIGTARMAMEVGSEAQREFLERLGLLSTLRTELPETNAPISPRNWSTLNSVTISYGHGVSVSPLQTAAATAALMNGGYYVPPTFLPRTPEEAAGLARRVVKPETSDAMRMLMRMTVEKGTGRRAEVLGYRVGGKTGTAEKVVNGRYASGKRRNVFLAAFPMDEPRYVVLVLLDEPQPEKPGMGATAGLNTAPTVAAIVRRIAPMLGIEPRLDGPDDEPATAVAAVQ
jgi:cell division protein FtsI (penicillin-binding protein 3)